MRNVTAKIIPLILPKNFGEIRKGALVGKVVQKHNQTRNESAGVTADKVDQRLAIGAFGQSDNTDAVMANAPRTTSQVPEFARRHFDRLAPLRHKSRR